MKQFGTFLKDGPSSSKQYFSAVIIHTRVQQCPVNSLWELSYSMASAETLLVGSLRDRVLKWMEHRVILMSI